MNPVITKFSIFLFDVIYELTIFALKILLSFASYFNINLNNWLNQQKADFQFVFSKYFNPNNQPIIWFHASSRGEFKMVQFVISKVKQFYPDHFILLSYFSPSGYLNHKEIGLVDKYIYLPFDSKKSMKLLVEKINPSIFILSKNDLWKNLLEEIQKKKKCKSLFLNFVLIEKKISYLVSDYLPFKKILLNFTTITSPSNRTFDILKNLNFSNIILCPDLRFVEAEGVSSRKNEFITNKNDRLITYGSIYIKDLEILMPKILSLSGFNHVFVPHDISTKNINKILKFFNENLVFPTLIKSPQELNDFNNQNYYLVNSFGSLNSFYEKSFYSFVGGSLNNGIHNIFEPISYYNKVYLIKPKKENPEVELFLKKNFAFESNLYFHLENLSQIPIDFVFLNNFIAKNSQLCNAKLNEHLKATQS